MNITITQQKKHVCNKLLEVFGVLARCLSYDYMMDGEVVIKTIGGLPLLHVASTTLTTPITEITDRVFQQTSSLLDAFISMADFAKFVDHLNKKDEVKGLDHVGFCYMTRSQEKELADIKDARSDLHLYEMTSNDLAKWYFVGDRSNWKDPMVELLPTLPNDDPESPYWMPHIHIDIETTLGGTEIEKVIKDIFKDTRHPSKFSHPTYGVYSVRLWLGTVSGVNIILDVGTNVINLQWIRAHLLYEK